jgi:hypothetical protein
MFYLAQRKTVGRNIENSRARGKSLLACAGALNKSWTKRKFQAITKHVAFCICPVFFAGSGERRLEIPHAADGELSLLVLLTPVG